MMNSLIPNNNTIEESNNKGNWSHTEAGISPVSLYFFLEKKT